MKRYKDFRAGLMIREEKVSLGDGEHVLKPSKFKQLHHKKYDIYDKKGKVGIISLKKHDEAHHSSEVVSLDQRARGKGVGSKAITALHKHLGGKISSCSTGDTSPEAKKMWERIPGVEKEASSNKNGYVYTKK